MGLHHEAGTCSGTAATAFGMGGSVSVADVPSPVCQLLLACAAKARAFGRYSVSLHLTGAMQRLCMLGMELSS